MTVKAKKVYELGRELDIPSKELLEKIKDMGIDVKSHMSGLQEEDVVVIKNALNKNNVKQETKIVKATNKKQGKEELEPKVEVKKATGISVNNTVKNQKKKEQDKKTGTSHKATVGTSVINKEEKKDSDAKVEEKKKPVVHTVGVDGKIQKVEKKEDKNQEKESKKPVEPKEESVKEPVKKMEKVENKKVEKKQETSTKGQTLKILKKFDPEAEKKKKEEAEKKRKLIEEERRKHRSQQNQNKDRKKENRGAEDRNKDNQKNKDNKFKGNKGNQDRQNRDNSGFKKDKNNEEFKGHRSRKTPDRDELTPIVEKPNSKRGEKHKEKERDKFAKLEKGAKNKNKMRSLEKIARPKKNQNKPKQEEPEEVVQELPEGTTLINVPITVAGFCEQLEISTSTVIMKLMKLGIMANINQNIDEDTVLVLAEELGVEVVIGKVVEEETEIGIEDFKDDEKDLEKRAPIITVMGHVDHGKTSLLDAIRKTNVTASESGGITQHIGASEVNINGQKIVLLDTPGHEAFTAMRARGAHVTDIAILVVAADDSVKPQTVESISHAKAAGVPIIVAINKIDKPGANPDKVLQDLTEHGILVEDWGGDTISAKVSAKTGEGIVHLLEMVLLQAEIMELKANPNRLALGTVIDAKLDKSKGPVATLLVSNGTLHSGQSVVVGTCAGRIRLMNNFRGEKIKKAEPSTAVEILGLTDVPQAGDSFNVVREDKIAREIAEMRKNKLREEVLAKNSSTTLEKLFSQIQEGEVKDLNLIVKGDVQGSVGAIESSLEKLKTENVRVKVVHSGVGTVTESDVMLAETTGAVIIGFNVRPSNTVVALADRAGIEIRTYRVIYDVIEDVETAMKGMLEPEFKEEVLGTVEVRTTFKVSGVGTIAGAYVSSGKVVRNAEIRLVRDGIVYHEGKISSLKRFKDDAKEVQKGFECGIGFENYNDLKEGDVIECFHMVEIARK